MAVEAVRETISLVGCLLKVAVYSLAALLAAFLLIVNRPFGVIMVGLLIVAAIKSMAGRWDTSQSESRSKEETR